jgi:hypothetical protein
MRGEHLSCSPLVIPADSKMAPLMLPVTTIGDRDVVHVSDLVMRGNLG